jgi:NTE family protein
MSVNKIGLALGGGAARGWAHIGVIKQLNEWGIQPDIVTGTSIGALVGASYASDKLDDLEQWVLSLGKLETAKYFKINKGMRGFVDRKKLQQFLNDFVCLQDTKIESLAVRFASVATDLKNGDEVWNKSGSLADAVWSSIALPGLFPAIKVDEKWLLDGGLVNPVPVSTCKALGADKVIAVNLNHDLLGQTERLENQQEDSEEKSGMADKISSFITDYTDKWFGGNDQKEDTPDLLDAIAATITITQDKVVEYCLAESPPDVMVCPKLGHIGLLEFYRAQEAIDIGAKTIQQHKNEILSLIE